MKNNLNVAMLWWTPYNYFREIYGYKNIPTEEEIALKERSKTFLKKTWKNEAMHPSNT